MSDFSSWIGWGTLRFFSSGSGPVWASVLLCSIMVRKAKNLIAFLDNLVLFKEED